jgi:hypothetical protein
MSAEELLELGASIERIRKEDPGFPDVLARARAKARELSGEVKVGEPPPPKPEPERPKQGDLSDGIDRFMQKGPAQYRVLNDEWWNR